MPAYHSDVRVSLVEGDLVELVRDDGWGLGLSGGLGRVALGSVGRGLKMGREVVDRQA